MAWIIKEPSKKVGIACKSDWQNCGNGKIGNGDIEIAKNKQNKAGEGAGAGDDFSI